MELTFLGATETVTGSKYLLETSGKRYMVDCGLFQGYKELRERNWKKLPIAPDSLDGVFLTHAHIDHSGYLPLLVKNGFRKKIYATHGTRDLCELLLPDSGYLQEEDARRANKYGYSKHSPAVPLYTMLDGKRALDYFHAVDYDEPVSLAGDVRLTLRQAGHILGASMAQVECEGKRILFTGDLGRPQDDILYPPADFGEIDYLVIESTYGDRKHEKIDPLQEIADVVNRTVQRGGTVLIPSFAVGRAQNILYYLYMLRQAGKISEHIPIYLDSPMAISATEIFWRHAKHHRLSPQMAREICDTATYVHTPEESKELDHSSMPSIIISASGMATGGRILHHLRHFAPQRENTLLFVGYQAEGTRGDRIVKGETEVKMLGETVPIRAEVVNLNNMSAHADYEEMLGYLDTVKGSPKVFVTHGESEVAEAWKTRIEERCGWECRVPTYGEKVRL